MTRAHTWARDLGLGLRLAFRGARTRTALTATGIGLGVGVLLFAASLPGAISARQDREAARSLWGAVNAATPDSRQPTDDTALVADVTTIWQGDRVSGRIISPDGSSPPIPPGLDRVPGPGELFVSPALADTLRGGRSADLLRTRLGGGRVVGTIGPAGLTGPRERFWYGHADLNERLFDAANVDRLSKFGGNMPDPVLGAMLRLIVVIGAVVLLFPIAILVGTAARFGSERRDRRLAALRLVGTSRRGTARIAAGESLAGALLGIVGGAVLFAGARQTLSSVEAFGFSLFPADARPDPLLAALVLLGVLIVTIGTTLLSMRRVAVEPLAVSRRGRPLRRRLWWRPVPIIAGFAVLLPIARGASDSTGDHLWQVGIGAVLALIGVVALLPWVIDAVVGRLRGWSPSSLLAVRALQSDGAGSARIVSGVAVAIAGAITLQMLLAAEATQPATATSTEPRGTATASLPARIGDLGRVRNAIEATPGVRSASVFTTFELQALGRRSGAAPALTIGDCRALMASLTVDRCSDRAGAIYRVLPSPHATSAAPALPQTVAILGGERLKARPFGAERWDHFALPSNLPTATARPDAPPVEPGLYATPAAVPIAPGAMTSISVRAVLDSDAPLALEQLRSAAAQVSPLANVYESLQESDAATNSAIRRVLMAGATLLLMLIAASLLVTTLEQLGERRRSLATLAALGTPRSVLRRALWWQTALPVGLGMSLSLLIGTALGAALVTLQNEPVAIDVSGTSALLALGAGLIGVVTGIALPLLGRVASPSVMRSE